MLVFDHLPCLTPVRRCLSNDGAGDADRPIWKPSCSKCKMCLSSTITLLIPQLTYGVGCRRGRSDGLMAGSLSAVPGPLHAKATREDGLTGSSLTAVPGPLDFEAQCAGKGGTPAPDPLALSPPVPGSLAL